MRTALPAALWLAVSVTLWCAPASAVELRVSGDRVFVPVVINGVSVEALLDSGAETLPRNPGTPPCPQASELRSR